MYVLGEERISHSKSFYNVAQADVIAVVLSDLLKFGNIQPEDISILTFYDGQKDFLHSQQRMAQVSIATVDGFQGDERPVILLSIVRSNPEGDIGFVKKRSG